MSATTIVPETATPAEPDQRDVRRPGQRDVRRPGQAEERQPLSVRIVERIAHMFGGRRSTRRSFLYRAAMVGSALAVDPFGYVLKPGTAYASVCGDANTCSGGWSVFCCTINGGANTCPAYSYVAGWWKVDASAFCLGAPRYYIDCNRKPNDTCTCRCNTTGCDRRRVCCNVFRYGQCNTQIKGVTAVVCRIITCTPPWEWDPKCGRTVRTSESTRTHTSTCLPGTNPSRVELKYQDLGLAGSVVGRPDGAETTAAGGGRKRRYTKGMILWHPDHDAHEVHASPATFYRRAGAERSALGYPKTDHRRVGDGSGDLVRFERGSIYRRFGQGPHMVLWRADRRYRKVGGPRGRLGYPTSDTVAVNPGGRQTTFERGAIFMSSDTDAVELVGRFAGHYTALGGPAESGLGFPVAPARKKSDGTRRQRFQTGIILGGKRGRVFAVLDPIRRRYTGTMGGPTGTWGYPVTDTGTIIERDGLWQRFQHAVVYWHPDLGLHWFERGPLYRRYRVEGGAAGPLGFPVTNQQIDGDGIVTVNFEHGAITYDPSTGATTVSFT